MFSRLFHFILLVGLFQTILACQQTPRQELLTSTSWKLVGVISRPVTASKKDSIPAAPPQNQTLNISYTFQKDKKYALKRASQIDKGEWGISSDEKILLLRSHTQESENSEFRIHILNTHKLVVSSEHKTKQEILYFIAKN